MNFQDLSTVQNKLMQTPRTIASATTIAPTTFLTFITGTAVVATITPPVDGAHLLCMVWTDTPTETGTTNIKTAITPTEDLPTFFAYNPVDAKYYGWATNVT